VRSLSFTPCHRT